MKSPRKTGTHEARAAAGPQAWAIEDYRIACRSREASLVGRREVFTGKAKFGIFGDGKEIAQLALARAFRPGDFRSGYYRDQTFMLAIGALSVEQFFAQLYADPDVTADPSSAGRSMTAHFGTRFLDERGRWRELATAFNTASDISPTAAQMPRLVGLAYASKLYRELPGLAHLASFSNRGAEIAFGTIGNASCAEGLFWESVNAIGVLDAPALISVWDDGYGISVPNDLQVTKGNVSEALEGFRRNDGDSRGFALYRVVGWDYEALVATYLRAARGVRDDRIPAIVHVVEMTQPQGHSTSGSHERYKPAERLRWEDEHDGLKRMRAWIVEQGIAAAADLERLEAEEREHVRAARTRAWNAFMGPVLEAREALAAMLDELAEVSSAAVEVRTIREGLLRRQNPARRELIHAAADALVAARRDPPAARERIAGWMRAQESWGRERYGSHLLSESEASPLHVPAVAPAYGAKPEMLRGFEILTRCFDDAFARHPELIAFGEDVGRLGDVNQGLAGLQEKHGPLRIADSGIREATLIGQAIGMAMRGLRPLVEIQYLDYVLYGLQLLSDDLACLRWRTAGGQQAPVIVRTRGHRLEGIWHSGSPMAGIVHLVRGIHVCVPRDMTRAAGMYNTLLRGDDPAIVVEVLNGYRLREPLPDNLAEFTVPLGVPEILRPGTDVTLVTYGACCRIALEAADQLAHCGVEVEVIDVQTLLPFDRGHAIVESLRKTARVVFVDEDVPGGASAYMLREVLETQDGYRWLDSPPRTVSAAAHRPAYGSDGDYWSKPNRESIFRTVYDLLREADPVRYPPVY